MHAGLSLLAALLLAGISSGAWALSRPQTAPDAPRIVDVSAERFAFAPSEIRTTTGTTLRFRLRSEDTDHGFHILGTGVNIEIPKRGRGTATVDFTPDRAGTYTFECSHVCGAGHSFMRGVILVRDLQPEKP
jgi:cytochrome c oxidase subunit 2